MKKLVFCALLGFLGIEAYAGSTQLGLSLEGLEPMKGQHYEGWNIVNGRALSTGRFQLSSNGKIYLVDANGRAKKRIGQDGHAYFDLQKLHARATTFVLTIEPNGDVDPGPSDVHVMGGHFRHGKTELSVDHASSLGTDFGQSDGTFILAAPTGGEFNQGVWFVDPSRGEGSLHLPELPNGWAYEGWVVNTKNGRLFSTGIFRNAKSTDSDNAGPLAGKLKLNFPPVPGQDVVKSPLALNDGIHSVVVSVEPYPDYDSRPFSLKVLSGRINRNLAGGESSDLNNIVAETAPSGSAVIHRK